ncbi:MAG TPA: ParB/RepB/Spo0J family partition protein [bacterium]|nr:ParB/RepB/Spo0J family partition protein [bacterium]
MTTDLRNENNKLHTRKALGRGLAALLPEAQFEDRPNETITRYETTNNSNSYFMCPIDKLIASSQQPRQRFAQEEINELSESIKENGLIQPILVRKRGNDTYEIIAGERRWRASKQAGLREVPVIFKEMSDKATLLTALIENIQRADLNAIEEGRAYKQLIDEYNMTQEDVSRKVGKDRSTVTNCLRLLKLPDNIQKDIETGRISVGHAKLLCSLDNDQYRNKVAQQIVEKDLSVRDTESLINKLKTPPRKVSNINKKEDLFNSIEDNLRQKFHTKVNIKGSYEKGSFVIEYFNKEDFERILGLFFN